MNTMSAPAGLVTSKAFLHSLKPSTEMRVALLAVTIGGPPFWRATRSRQAAPAATPGGEVSCKSQRKGAWAAAGPNANRAAQAAAGETRAAERKRVRKPLSVQAMAIPLVGEITLIPVLGAHA